MPSSRVAHVEWQRSIKKLGLRLAQLYNAHMIRILSPSLSPFSELILGCVTKQQLAPSGRPSALPSLRVVLKLYLWKHIHEMM